MKTFSHPDPNILPKVSIHRKNTYYNHIIFSYMGESSKIELKISLVELSRLFASTFCLNVIVLNYVDPDLFCLSVLQALFVLI